MMSSRRTCWSPRPSRSTSADRRAAASALRDVRTVIVDEIHALARDKRGSHLALTLERLEALAKRPRPQRIGLSATQRPIETVARLLVGAGEARARRRRAACRIVDLGHRRAARPGHRAARQRARSRRVRTSSGREILDRIAALVARAPHDARLRQHAPAGRAGRAPARRAPRRGAAVAAHHGSLSKERRLRARGSGSGRATCRRWWRPPRSSSGIDIGPVELVCQIGSPRSIATLLQRVGRVGPRARARSPKGRLFPHHARRARRVRGAARARCARASSTAIAAARGAARRPRAADRGRRAPRDDWTEDELFALVAARRAVRATWTRAGLRRRGARCSPRASRPARGRRAAPTCTATASTACCGPRAARASPR